LQVRDGQLLVVAHVVSARLSDLFGKTQHSARRALRSPLPQTLVAQSAAEIELVASDGAHGRALIRVPRGELGPMTIELCLEQGRLQVRATVIDERAARALSDERALLAQSLALQGVELGEFSVVVEPRRPTRKTKPQAPASDTKGKEK
jgi:flagellar hook-length control protein FliK